MIVLDAVERSQAIALAARILAESSVVTMRCQEVIPAPGEDIRLVSSPSCERLHQIVRPLAVVLEPSDP